MRCEGLRRCKCKMGRILKREERKEMQGKDTGERAKKESCSLTNRSDFLATLLPSLARVGGYQNVGNSSGRNEERQAHE